MSAPRRWTSDDFRWHDAMSLKVLVSQYAEQTPFLIKFVTGYLGRDEDMHHVSTDDMCWLHDIIAQQRVVVRNRRGDHYSVPVSYEGGVLPITAEGQGKVRVTLREILRATDIGKFVFAGDTPGCDLLAYSGADGGRTIGRERLEIVDTYTERYLSVHHVARDGLVSAFRLIPAYMPVDVTIAVDHVTGSVQFYNDMLELKQCSDALPRNYATKRSTLSYILQFDRDSVVGDYEFLPLPTPDSSSGYGSVSTASLLSKVSDLQDDPMASPFWSIRSRDQLVRLAGQDPDSRSMSTTQDVKTLRHFVPKRLPTERLVSGVLRQLQRIYAWTSPVSARSSFNSCRGEPTHRQLVPDWGISSSTPNLNNTHSIPEEAEKPPPDVLFTQRTTPGRCPHEYGDVTTRRDVPKPTKTSPAVLPKQSRGPGVGGAPARPRRESPRSHGTKTFTNIDDLKTLYPPIKSNRDPHPTPTADPGHCVTVSQKHRPHPHEGVTAALDLMKGNLMNRVVPGQPTSPETSKIAIDSPEGTKVHEADGSEERTDRQKERNVIDDGSEGQYFHWTDGRQMAGDEGCAVSGPDCTLSGAAGQPCPRDGTRFESASGQDDSLASPRFASVRDVPGDMSALSIAAVGRCLALLGLSRHCRAFQDKMVDGELLTNMDATMLKAEFHMTAFDAYKLVMFVGGWRPK